MKTHVTLRGKPETRCGLPVNKDGNGRYAVPTKSTVGENTAKKQLEANKRSAKASLCGRCLRGF